MGRPLRLQNLQSFLQKEYIHIFLRKIKYGEYVTHHVVMAHCFMQ